MGSLAFLGNLAFGELMIIAVVVLLLFGSAKIPDLMRSMGSGISEFKKGLREGEAAEKAPAPEKPATSDKETPPQP